MGSRVCVLKDNYRVLFCSAKVRIGRLILTNSLQRGTHRLLLSSALHMHDAGVDMGMFHLNHHSVDTFLYICARTTVKSLCVALRQPLRTFQSQLRSDFCLAMDHVTLPTGVKVLIAIIAHTTVVQNISIGQLSHICFV